MTRRGVLIATGVGFAAAIGGLGWRLWRESHDEPGLLETYGKSIGVVNGAQVVAVADRPVDLFWTADWQGPNGETVDARQWRGKSLLINYWGTWCPPCVEEMPLLDRFYRQNVANGFQMVGIAVDQAEKVAQFLSKNDIRFPVIVSGAAGIEWAKKMGNSTGGLPYTVLVAGDGTIAARRPGPVTQAILAEWLVIK